MELGKRIEELFFPSFHGEVHLFGGPVYAACWVVVDNAQLYSENSLPGNIGYE